MDRDLPTNQSDDSYIVRCVTRAVQVADHATLYGFLARRLLPTRYGNWRFVDTWVLSHLALAFTAWLALGMFGRLWVFLLLLIYGAFRAWEICLTALSVALGGRPDAEFTVLSVRRSLILGVLNYVEVMFWFAAAYAYFANQFAESVAPLVATLTGSFYYSILTMATYGDIAPVTTPGRWLVSVHLLVSIYLTIGVLGRLVSVLPRPRPRDSSEREV